MTRFHIVVLVALALVACSTMHVIRFGRAPEKDMAMLDWERACIVVSIDGRKVGLRGTANVKNVKPLFAKLSPGTHELELYFEVHEPQSALSEIVHYTRTITQVHEFEKATRYQYSCRAADKGSEDAVARFHLIRLGPRDIS